MEYFIVHGRRYDVPENLTLGEARTLKRIAGCSLPQFEVLLAERDPDAMVAWLYVVVRRGDPRVTLEDIEALDPSEIEYHADEASPEVDEAAVPTEKLSDAGASETTGISETTPAAFGPRLSVTSSG